MGTTGGLGALGPALALGIPLALLAKGKICSLTFVLLKYRRFEELCFHLIILVLFTIN